MIAPDERSSDAIYTPLADGYGYDIDANWPARLKYELVRAHAEAEGRVLDVGCANGLHLVRLAALCRELVGVDINDRMLELATRAIAERGIRNVRIAKQSATRLDFPLATFDLVYSFSTLLLVPDTDRALAEIARVLRPGGIAILDITGRYNLSRLYWGHYYRRYGHFGIRSFTLAHIRQRLEDLGLELLEQHASGFCDQWKYLPGLNLLRPLERVFHGGNGPDLDYRVSNWPPLVRLANRWHFVGRKASVD